MPVGKVSVFDALWRFRRWANYQEADFERHASEFDNCFTEIVGATAVVLESVLLQYIGKDTLRALYEDYLKLVGNRLDCSAIKLRQQVLTSSP